MRENLAARVDPELEKFHGRPDDEVLGRTEDEWVEWLVTRCTLTVPRLRGDQMYVPDGTQRERLELHIPLMDDPGVLGVAFPRLVSGAEIVLPLGSAPSVQGRAREHTQELVDRIEKQVARVRDEVADWSVDLDKTIRTHVRRRRAAAQLTREVVSELGLPSKPVPTAAPHPAASPPLGTPKGRRPTLADVARVVTFGVLLAAPWVAFGLVPKHWPGGRGSYVVGALSVAGSFVLVLSLVFVPIVWEHVRAGAVWPKVMGVLVSVSWFVAGFACIYLQAAHDGMTRTKPVACLVHASSQSPVWRHLVVFYFSVTTFSTTGYGDITAHSSACRVVASAQMLLGMVLIGTGIAGLVTRVLAVRQISPRG